MQTGEPYPSSVGPLFMQGPARRRGRRIQVRCIKMLLRTGHVGKPKLSEENNKKEAEPVWVGSRAPGRRHPSARIYYDNSQFYVWRLHNGTVLGRLAIATAVLRLVYTSIHSLTTTSCSLGHSLAPQHNMSWRVLLNKYSFKICSLGLPMKYGNLN